MLRVAAVSTRDRQVCAGTMYFGGVLGRDTQLAKAGMYGASTDILLFSTSAFRSTKCVLWKNSS